MRIHHAFLVTLFLSSVLVMFSIEANAQSLCGDDDGDDDDAPAADIDPGTWTDPATDLTWTVNVTNGLYTLRKAAEFCDDLVMEGGGWRQPTIDELRTLVRGCYGVETGGVCQVSGECTDESCDNYDDCGCHPAADCHQPLQLNSPKKHCAHLVSSTVVTNYVFGISLHWSIDFRTARLGKAADAESHVDYVRCVRGPGDASDDDSGDDDDADDDIDDDDDDDDIDDDIDDDDGDETWTDTANGLTWQFDPPDTAITLTEAEVYCTDVDLPGEGWRIPTISELRTIVNGCPAIETGGECGVTDGCPSYYECYALDECNSCEVSKADCYLVDDLEACVSSWSVTSIPEHGGEVWALDFETARIYDTDSSQNIPVRCVRDN